MKHKTKLFYKDVNGKDTYLIAEGDSVAQSAENAVKEYQVLREIYGEDKLPISNITRMDKIVDNWNESLYTINVIERICL